MDLTISEYQKYLLRLDPTDFKGDFSIKRVMVNDGRKDVISLNGKQFRKYISGIGDANVKVCGKDLKVEGLNNDCRFIIDSKFNQQLTDNCIKSNLELFYTVFVIYFIFGILQFVLCRKQQIKKIKCYDIIKIIFTIIVVTLGNCLIYGEYYLTENFEDVSLGQLIYHLHTPLDGTNTSSFTVVIVSVVLIVVMSILVVIFGYWGLGVLKRQSTFLNWIFWIGGIEIVYAVVIVCFHFDTVNYFKYINQETTIY
jgi:hypothetical protein